MLIDQIASYALDGISALVILLVGWWIAGRAHFLVRRALDRVPRIDDTLKPFLSSSVRYFVIVITVVAVLAEFGGQTTPHTKRDATPPSRGPLHAPHSPLPAL